MEIKYSDHLRFKMRVRNIPENLPERICRESVQRYYNHHTLRHIAVMETHYQGLRTLMMIAYDQFPDHIEILTIHPITKKQIQDRLKNERWTHEQARFEL
jgi:hypothetical protein